MREKQDVLATGLPYFPQLCNMCREGVILDSPSSLGVVQE